MSNIDDMNLGPEEVVRYLRTHPEFFEDHADMLTEIQVPHPHGGGGHTNKPKADYRTPG